MEVLWYIILWLILGLYLLFEGYEWGARIVYFLYTSNDDERRQVLESTRSVWSANEIWLLAYIGLMYLVFPGFFAWNRQYFEGIFYLFVVLYVLSVAVNNLLRIFDDRPARKLLNLLFFAAQAGMTVLMGLYVAVLLRGWNGASIGLWSRSFSPFSGDSGYLDWFTLLFVFLFFILILLQGLGWTVHKVRPALGRKLKFKIQKWAVYGSLIFLGVIAALYFMQAGRFKYFFAYPVWFLLPVLMLSAFGGLMAVRSYASDNKGFLLATNLFIYFWLGLMVLQYPYLVHSTEKNQGISIFHTVFHSLEHYHLQWWVIAVTLILLIYSVLVHKFSKGKSLREAKG